MSKRTLLIVSIAFLAYLAGASLADTPAPAQPPAPPKADAAPAPGRYAVTAMGSSAVMVETATGKTWVLRGSADGAEPTWIPVARIDKPEDAAKWLDQQRKRDQDLLERRLVDRERLRQLEAELAQRRATEQMRREQEQAGKRP